MIIMHLPCALQKSRKLKTQIKGNITKLCLSINITCNFMLVESNPALGRAQTYLTSVKNIKRRKLVGHVTISDGEDRVIITVKLTSKSHLYASLTANDMVIWLS